MKKTTCSLILGSVVMASAIERPGGGASTVPAEPKGGILGGDTGKKKLQLAEQKAEVPAQVAYLGVRGEGISDALKVHLDLEHGLLLTTVDPESPAGLSGLKENDIILSLGDCDMKDQDVLREEILKHEPGAAVTLKLLRRGKEVEEEITLGVAPLGQNIAPLALVPDPAAEMNRLMNRQPGFRLGGIGDEDLQQQLMEQLRRAFGEDGMVPGADQGMRQLRLQLNNLNGEKFNGMQQFGSVRLQDGAGSVEMKMEAGKRTVIVRDREGVVQFEGPFNTDEEKAAVPEEFQDRVKRLDVENGMGGLRLQLGGFEPKPGGEEGE